MWIRVFSNMFTAHGADRSDDMGRVCARACAFIFARANFDFETPSQGIFSERDDILFGSYLRVVSWFLRLRSESRLGSAGGNPNSPVPKLYWVSRIPFCPSVEST